MYSYEMRLLWHTYVVGMLLDRCIIIIINVVELSKVVIRGGTS